MPSHSTNDRDYFFIHPGTVPTKESGVPSAGLRRVDTQSHWSYPAAASLGSIPVSSSTGNLLCGLFSVGGHKQKDENVTVYALVLNSDVAVTF